MKEAKFWLLQIVMVVIVSLVFGSPVWADDNDDDRGSHQQMQHDNDDDGENDGDDYGEDDDDGGMNTGGSSCSSAAPQLCTTQMECTDAGGFWAGLPTGCMFEMTP